MSSPTNNVNKTWALLQTTGGKDESYKRCWCSEIRLPRWCEQKGRQKLLNLRLKNKNMSAMRTMVCRLLNRRYDLSLCVYLLKITSITH